MLPQAEPFHHGTDRSFTAVPAGGLTTGSGLALGNLFEFAVGQPYHYVAEWVAGLLWGVTTYWRRHRSSNVTGPRGPGTWSTLIPVSGTPRSLNPSSRRVLAFQKAPVPA